MAKRTRGATGVAAASMATAGAASVGAKRPKYLVLFRERSGRNVSAMSSVLGVGEAKGMQARATQTVLATNHEWAAHPRVYERMGVAVADLDADEKDELSRNDAVEAIVENQVRTIPPIIEAAASPAPPSGLEGIPPTAAPPAVGLDVRQADSLLSYLRGVRDTTDMLLRAMERAPQRGLPQMRVAEATGSSAHAWHLSLIGLHEGYMKATGRGVRVAVLDTGIDLTHPDFAGRFAGGNDTQSFIPGESVQDGNGHGTHCAGVIAGKANSAGGRRYSVAPDAELIVGKVLSNAGSGFDDQILDGIDWAVDAGAQVISMSLGSPRNKNQPFADAYEIVASNLMAMRPGVLVVAAAGNESSGPNDWAAVGNPAACPSIMAVTAIDRWKQVADFACRKMDDVGAIDISAPGVAIYSSWKDAGFRTISGTSMATPIVAGVAALAWELQQNLQAAALWQRLESLCVNIGSDDIYGSGLIQVP